MGKRLLFIANTLYQVIISIYIKQTMFSSDEVADLFVCSETKYLNEIIKTHSLNNIFDKVSLVEYSKVEAFEAVDGIKGNIRHLHRAWNPDWFMKRMGCELSFDYSEIFFYVPGRCFKDIYKVSSRKKDIKLHYYQHGVDTYLGSKNIAGMQMSRDTFADKFYEFISRKKHRFNIEDLKFDMYCFSSELMPKDEKRVIIEIPNNKWSIAVKQSINTALNYEPQTNIKEKFIFFEQASEYIGNEGEYFNVIDVIVSIVGIDNFVIKKHPRMQLPTKHNYHVYQGGEAWEEYLINNDISEKVLITVSSTAASTAKYMFGQDCTIIYCYNLLKNFMSKEVLWYTYFYENTQDYYGNVFIAKDMNDLKEILSGCL